MKRSLEDDTTDEMLRGLVKDSGSTHDIRGFASPREDGLDPSSEGDDLSTRTDDPIDGVLDKSDGSRDSSDGDGR